MNKHMNVETEFYPRPVVPMPLAPRKYTAADILFFVKSGLIDDAAKFELFDGEIVPMSPKGAEHEATRLAIARWLRGRWAAKFDCLQELTLTVDDGTVVEPDFALFKPGIDLRKRRLKGTDIHLVIEVADSSLGYDLKKKSKKYAAFGVAEYWVIDANTGEAYVHRGPEKRAWSEMRKVAPHGSLAPLCAPKAVLKL